MINYKGNKFSGYNKPKATPGESKKSAVLAKEGDNEYKTVARSSASQKVAVTVPLFVAVLKPVAA